MQFLVKSSLIFACGLQCNRKTWSCINFLPPVVAFFSSYKVMLKTWFPLAVSSGVYMTVEKSGSDYCKDVFFLSGQTLKCWFHINLWPQRYWFHFKDNKMLISQEWKLKDVYENVWQWLHRCLKQNTYNYVDIRSMGKLGDVIDFTLKKIHIYSTAWGHMYIRIREPQGQNAWSACGRNETKPCGSRTKPTRFMNENLGLNFTAVKWMKGHHNNT